VDDARGEGIFPAREIFEGPEEGAYSDVLVGLLRPEDHPKTLDERTSDVSSIMSGKRPGTTA
jgi:hypothetical protein